MSKINFFKSILLLNIFFLTLGEDIIYRDETIEDMESSFFKKIDKGFHHLKDDILPKGHKIIAFSDINNDGYTDLITYQKEKDKNIYNFFSYTYDKENKKFNGEKLFNINDDNLGTIRNVHVGSFYQDSGICYLCSFNDKNNNAYLIHYIRCNNEDAIKMKINSNILILNKKKNGEGQILHFNENNKRVICKLNSISHVCGGDNDEDFGKFFGENCKSDSYVNRNISKDGGLAFVDLNGNCAPDIVLSYEDKEDIRHIEIYRATRENNDEYCFIQDITVGKKSEYGAFTISRIKNEKSKKNIPNFDILIPNLKTNQIIAYKNLVKKGYEWDEYYCDEGKKNMGETKGPIFYNEPEEFNLTKIDENKEQKFDTNSITIIRPGDFLGNLYPGILVKLLVGTEETEEKPVIALFSKNGDCFDLFLNVTKIEGKIGNPERAFFFDINESGTLSIIVETDDEKNHILFNYRNSFFIKSKLMNEKKDYYDVNLGSISRYIVTDQDGDRHMEISYQLPQTSDMSMPLPYSLSGLGETNNYVENFQIMSGNYYADADFESSDNKNFMKYTPIIPNTQMKIIKFKNEDKKYEWLIELIIQPMDQIVILVIIMIVVMLALLGVIIYLHIREVKEEQKETTKFKSWFA